MKQYCNALVYGEDFRFHRGGFSVADGRFVSVLSGGGQGEDLGGAYVLPGFVDLHIHGSAGADCSDGDAAGFRKIARCLSRHGVTSFIGTTMTLPEDQLTLACKAAADYAAAPDPGGAVLRGLRLEGPFLSDSKRGAQNQDYLRLPDLALLERLDAASGDRIRIVDVAPEQPGAVEFIAAAARRHLVSIAHTAADYDTAMAAISAGARQLTHLYNGMPDLLHRSPGVIGAAADSPEVSAELIADGVHSHPAMIRAAYRLFGPERLILISDALRCAGMPIGAYQLGGQTVVTDGRTARLLAHPETLAGSAQDLFSLFLSAVSFGVPAEDAIRMATFNPARALGLDAQIGAIAAGHQADFLICDSNCALTRVFIAGTEIER